MTITQPALITALKTPYDRHGAIDLAQFSALLERQIAGGVGGVIVGGTSGEGHLLSAAELDELLMVAVAQARGRVLVIGNTGAMSTRSARQLTERGFAAGMDAALIVNPYYGKTSSAGLARHFAELSAIGPLVLYNVPARTGQDIPLELIYALAERGTLYGVKECGGAARIAALSRHGIAAWSGNDETAREDIARHGAAGAMSVVSNLVPRLAGQYFRGDDNPSSHLVQQLIAWMGQEFNPMPVNTAMAMLDLCLPVFRLPYVPMDETAQAAGSAIFDALARYEPECAAVHRLASDSVIYVG